MSAAEQQHRSRRLAWLACPECGEEMLFDLGPDFARPYICANCGRSWSAREVTFAAVLGRDGLAAARQGAES